MNQDPADKSNHWIAQEALNAVLPPGWVEHKTHEDAVYYFNTDSKESSWEHPTDEYYRFLYKKMRKMKKKRQRSGEGGASVPYTIAQRERDRELVDVLWGLREDKKVQAVRERVAHVGLSDASSLPPQQIEKKIRSLMKPADGAMPGLSELCSVCCASPAGLSHLSPPALNLCARSSLSLHSAALPAHHIARESGDRGFTERGDRTLQRRGGQERGDGPLHVCDRGVESKLAPA
jgi:hypothetical protein